jgi:hypothetical protein
MMRFAFWNLRRNPAIAPLVAELGRSREIDVLVLAECPIGEAEMLATLNASIASETQYFRPETFRPNLPVEIFARTTVGQVLAVEETGHWVIREIVPVNGIAFLLVAAHLISKREFDEDSQATEMEVFADAVRDAERRRGHQRTIIVGDLNVNPFEKGMVSTRGLHAVPSRTLASEGERTVQEREYSFFYNPMWSKFGDHEGVPGTYFARRSEHVCYFWNMFDQVLLRPQLTTFWQSGSLEIVESIGEMPLLRNGVPDRANLSDHLPIAFSLHI